MTEKCVMVCLLVLATSASSFVDAKQQAAGFSLTQHTQAHQYKVTLRCDSALSVGDFQSCHLDVYRPATEMSLLKNAKISIAGGMPAHHHGLPTSPVVSWSKTKNTYIIEGLKFSMPGEWQLRFLIENNPSVHDKPFEEKVAFTFTL